MFEILIVLICKVNKALPGLRGPVLSARYQLKLLDCRYGASVSRGMPVYSPDFAATHLPTPGGWHAELAFVHGSYCSLIHSGMWLMCRVWFG